MGQLVKALAVSRPTKFKPPTFSGDREEQLFLNQFKDVAEANDWSERDALLHLRGYLEIE